jgi:hypothetical protein
VGEPVRSVIALMMIVVPWTNYQISPFCVRPAFVSVSMTPRSKSGGVVDAFASPTRIVASSK